MWSMWGSTLLSRAAISDQGFIGGGSRKLKHKEIEEKEGEAGKVINGS